MKKSKTIRRQYDPNYKGSPGKIFKKPSLTVPDQSLSLEQLLRHHTREVQSGSPPPREGYYNTLIPHISDLNDIAEMRQELAEQEKLIKQKIEDEKQKALDTTETGTTSGDQHADSKTDLNKPDKKGDKAKETPE